MNADPHTQGDPQRSYGSSADPIEPFLLETAVGCDRVGCDAARSQGQTTLRAREREGEQRRQHAAVQINRVRSALSQLLEVFVTGKFNLKIAVERARGGCAVAIWQGATTPRARARKAEQRRQGATALRHRVRSAFTQKVMGLVCENARIHQGLPAEVSGQLRFLARLITVCQRNETLNCRFQGECAGGVSGAVGHGPAAFPSHA